MATAIAMLGTTLATAAAGAGTAAATAGTAITAAAPYLQAAGTLASVVGGVTAAGAAKTAAQQQAAELDRAASDATAAAQRKAIDERRKVERVQSRLRAVAAKGGGGVESTIPLAAEIGAQGDYNIESLLYSGESRARDYRYKADAGRAKANSDYTGALFGVAAKGLQGGYNILKRW